MYNKYEGQEYLKGLVGVKLGNRTIRMNIIYDMN